MVEFICKMLRFLLQVERIVLYQELEYSLLLIEKK